MAKKKTERLSIKEMKEEIDKTIEDISQTISDSDETQIVVFIGNGISPLELDRNKIPENFIKELRKENPIRFTELQDDTKNFVQNYLDHTKISNVEMGEFIEKLNKFDYIKSKFYSHLKKICCRAQPTDKHFSLYSFCLLLNALRAIKSTPNNNLSKGLEQLHEKVTILRVFTTNYDNLLEKSYKYRNKEDYRKSFMRGIGKQGDFEFDKFFTDMEGILLVPEYIFELDDYNDRFGSPPLKSGFLPIVPIHNSIRASLCDDCRETMVSEIRGLGDEYCVYCGNKISEFIIPTEEGRARESIINLLLNEIQKTKIIIFVGYGFGDRHIMVDIVEKINSSEGDKKILVNLCREKITESKEFEKCNKSRYKPHDVYYDLPYSIDYANYKLAEKFKSEYENLYKGWKTIFEIYEKVL